VIAIAERDADGAQRPSAGPRAGRGPSLSSATERGGGESVAAAAPREDVATAQLSEPWVWRGAVRRWPACGRWTARALADAAPTWQVPVAALDDGRLALDRRRGLVLASRPLGGVVGPAGLLPGGHVMAPLDTLPPALAAALDEPTLVRGARWRSGKLWMAPAGTVTPLHFDVAHNFHALLSGRKRFLLFRRRDWPRLYPEPLTSGVPNFSRVDPLRPDLARFPRFAAARPVEYTLEAGDALVLPGGVWHHVTTERDSVAVSFWWARGLHALAAAAADRAKRGRRLSR
jgi:hypothetical protein